MPLGIINSGALITIAKDAGQTTKTISASNIEAMWAALPVPAHRRAVWLAHELAEKQLTGLAAPVPPTATALYMPQGTGGNEFPLLKGRPLLAIEQAKPIGTPGDIILADLTQYGLVDAGMRANLSMDVDFISDQGVFRFVWRVDGKPLWSSSVTSYSDSTQRSPFVALAER